MKPKHKPKILHIQLYPLLSGAQRVSLDEFRLCCDKFEYTLICKQEGDLTNAAAGLGIKVITIPELQREINFTKDLKAIKSIMKAIRDTKPDIVHTHSSKTGVLGRIAASLAGVKSIHTVHGYAFPSTQNLFKKTIYFISEFICAQLSSKIIVMNSQDFKLSKFLLAKRKTAYVANAIDCSIQNTIRIPKSEKCCVLYVGRFEAQKDPVSFIKIAEQLPSEKFKFTMIGSGSLDMELKDYVRRKKLKNIEFAGWVNNVGSYLTEADILLSTSKWEGMPLTILEAMLHEVIPVATSIPGHFDVIKEGQNGFLFEQNNSKLACKHIENILADQILSSKIKMCCKETVMLHYNLDDRCEKLRNLYTQILNLSDLKC